MVLANEFVYNGDVSRVSRIEFAIMSPEEIREQSVVEVEKPDTWCGNEPVPHGLFDARMGVLDNGRICPTDKQSNKFCPGYFGHIELARPVFYTQYFPVIVKILKCVCFRCSELLISKTDLDFQIIQRKPKRLRWNEMTHLATNSSKTRICPECKSPQPKFSQTKEEWCKLVAEWTSDDKEKENIKIDITPEIVLRIFENITNENCEALGFPVQSSRPEWLICQVLPVCPPAVRPSVMQENSQRSEDDLTHKYCDIIKANNQIATRLAQNPESTKQIDDWHKVLQYNISTLFDNENAGIPQATHRSGRPLKAIRQRLKAKDGRIRGNLMGKRVNYSARTVITPDPSLGIDEIGIPQDIAENMTYPEIVNTKNIQRLRAAILRESYPSARFVHKVHDNQTRTIRHLNPVEVAKDLSEGDIVYRHMIDGDTILFNRQPSLHKMSMMAHKVLVLKGKTFRFNETVTTPYNADFDGDEMNMHLPQSIAASNELKCLARISKQIINPGNSTPVINFVQDNVVGAYLLSQDDNAFSHCQMMNIMMMSDQYKYTPGKDTLKVYSGNSVLSRILPSDLRFKIEAKLHDDAPEDRKKDYVVNYDGVALDGILDKGVFKKIIPLVHKDNGDIANLNFLNGAKHVIQNYLAYRGFTVGIQDLVQDGDFDSMVQKTLAEKKLKVENLIGESLMKKQSFSLFESEISSELNETRADVAKEFAKLYKGECWEKRIGNRFFNMIDSGSKGQDTNLVQMVACLGQQAVDGQRIPYSFTNRTLPHFKQFDDGPEARGFINSSFCKGLNPTEFFFHAMGGREGLIDTAVKTSATGYIQRKLMKATEDLKAAWDGTIRDSVGNIVQFLYGDDGMDATHCEWIDLKLVDLSADQLDAHKLIYSFEDFTKDHILASAMNEMETECPNWKKELKLYYRDATNTRNRYIQLVKPKKDESRVQYPVHVSRILSRIVNQSNKSDKAGVTPIEIIEAYKKLIDDCSFTEINRATMLFEILLHYYASPYHLIVDVKISRKAFNAFCKELSSVFYKSLISPGEAVGPIAAQSIGEPCTQLTLNTFHQAGSAEKTNVTRGVPRLQELLHLTKSPKQSSTLIYLKPNTHVEIANTIKHTRLRSLVYQTSIFFESTARYFEDTSLNDLYKQFAFEDEKDVSKAHWVIQIDLDLPKMQDIGISIETIAQTMIQKLHPLGFSTYSTPLNSENVFVRVSISADEIAKQKQSANTSDDLDIIRNREQTILNLIVQGIEGIEDVILPEEGEKILQIDYNKYNEKEINPFASKERCAVSTNGKNMIELLGIDFVDSDFTVSNNIHEIYEVLGVEATRNVLCKEITEVITSAGCKINDRHIDLLVDVMTQKGELVSIDRHGINRNNIGPLAKCSFEQTEQELFNAALFGETDCMNGVSANIMLGQAPPVGTGTVGVLMDTQAMMENFPFEKLKNDIHSESESVPVEDFECEQLMQFDYNL